MKKYLLFIALLIMPCKAFAHEQITNLVIPVSYFVNHSKELANIENYLNKYRQASIIGTSGIGKTQLARTYAYEHKNQYDIIWFVDCNLDLNEEFLKLAKELNKTYKPDISEDFTLVKKEVMSYLGSRNKWLLVFDNLKVNNNKKVQDLVEWEHGGNIIFCSQDAEKLSHVIRMSAFSTKDSVSLATKVLESENLKIANFLADVFKGYPVMIVQGASLLNKVQGLSMEEYKRKILQSKDNVMFNIQLAINELKPTAKELLNKITLINNQRFSKKFLALITSNPDVLEDDIYSLSKFMLISNVDANEEDPIFEMHDVIVQKIWEINTKENNKKYLEDIIVRLVNYMPSDILKGHLFRHLATMQENLAVILSNAQSYNADIYKVMLLNVGLLTDYINSFDYYHFEKGLSWFSRNDQADKFKLLLMNNDEKRAYGEYLALTGAYYKRKYGDNNKYLSYYTKATEVLGSVSGHESIKCNIYYNLALACIALGYLEEANKNILIIKEMLDSGSASQENVIFVHLALSRLLLLQGKLPEALQEANNTIQIFLANGVAPEDLLLTNIYLLKADVLNSLEKYKEAESIELLLQEMYKSKDNNTHEAFSRIYTQIARSKLGFKQKQEATEYVNKAIKILLADETRNPKEADYSQDPDLAASYVAQGDIFFAEDNLKAAIESYDRARMIYFYLYRERSKNVAHVSYLYTQGAKAACKAKDSYHYDVFGHAQVEEFGMNHPNTTGMFEYCKQFDIHSPLKARIDD